MIVFKKEEIIHSYSYWALKLYKTTPFISIYLVYHFKEILFSQLKVIDATYFEFPGILEEEKKIYQNNDVLKKEKNILI